MNNEILDSSATSNIFIFNSKYDIESALHYNNILNGNIIFIDNVYYIFSGNRFIHIPSERFPEKLWTNNIINEINKIMEDCNYPNSNYPLNSKNSNNNLIDNLELNNLIDNYLMDDNEL